MEDQTLAVILQIAGFATTGGLIGEAYRSVNAGYEFNRYFIINSIASGFLAFLLAWGFFLYYTNRNAASIIAGIVSFQDEKKINRLIRSVLEHLLKGGSDKND